MREVRKTRPPGWQQGDDSEYQCIDVKTGEHVGNIIGTYDGWVWVVLVNGKETQHGLAPYINDAVREIEKAG